MTAFFPTRHLFFVLAVSAVMMSSIDTTIVAVAVPQFIPIYGVTHYGLSTLLSGTVLTPRAIAMSATATIASMWIIKTGYRRPMVIGVLATIVLALTSSRIAARACR